MTTEPQKTDPAAFDLDAWLHDAKLAEDSADIFQRPDVFGELTDLQRQIEDLKAASKRASDEPRQSDRRALAELNSRYEQLLEEFAASRLTVFVRAIPDEEIRELRVAHDARWQKRIDKDPKNRLDANNEFNRRLVAAAICALQPAGGERVDASFDFEMVKKLEDAVGGAQVKQIIEARQRAQLQAPEVTADFLRGASGTSKDGTSD